MHTDDDYLHAIQELSNTYSVPDVVLPSSRCFFILESPHVQELKHQVPVAGASGATMTKHLFGEAYGKIPLGLLVRDRTGDDALPGVKQIGLLNVCNIPMQAAAYSDPLISNQFGSVLSALEYIRSNSQTVHYRQHHLNTLQDELRRRLREKLLHLQSTPCTIIPCGRFAQKFFQLAAVHSPTWQVMEGVPHPSYNAWDRAAYAPLIARVVSAFKRSAQGTGR